MKSLLPLAGLVACLAGCRPHPDTAIILAGNSIPGNVKDVPFEESFMAVLPKALQAAHVSGSVAVTDNIAVHGVNTTQMMYQDSARIAQVYEGTKPAVLLFYEGTNDLWYVMLHQPAGIGAKAYQNLKQYFTYRKAQFPKLLTVTGTVMPRTDVPTPAVFERERLVLNDSLRQAWARKEPWLDGLADPAANPNMQRPSVTGAPTTYFKDGVHPNVVGLREITPLFAQAVATALTTKSPAFQRKQGL